MAVLAIGPTGYTFLAPLTAILALLAWRLLVLYRHGENWEEHDIVASPLGQEHAQ